MNPGCNPAFSAVLDDACLRLARHASTYKSYMCHGNRP